MAIETERNRDIFLKFCFMYFLNHVMVVLSIDEEIIDILPTEEITYKKTGRVKIFDNFFDFKGLTKSGKIVIFEFKKNTLTNNDLKQSFEYYTREFCKSSEDVELILIVMSKGGRIKEYVKLDLTFHPRIIKTKKINKQEDLNLIQNKFENNIMLTFEECSLLVTLPLFELDIGEAEIVIQTCEYVKSKKQCIPKEMYDKVVVGSYLNIVEYIGEDKQKKLMEMIGMAEKAKGVLQMYKEEMMDEFEKKIEIAKKLKGLHTPEEISKITGLSLKTVLLL
ncbi:hypothetical protein [Methanobrevibacter sp.]|uniref:hypothetical protein n=1 Tax=Methanobrevibacter sp. TaxID=66852 RepID=UPI00388D0088